MAALGAGGYFGFGGNLFIRHVARKRTFRTNYLHGITSFGRGSLSGTRLMVVALHLGKFWPLGHGIQVKGTKAKAVSMGSPILAPRGSRQWERSSKKQHDGQFPFPDHNHREGK
jgi:hypothetical protein